MSGTRWTETIGGTLYGFEKFTITGADTWLNDVGVTAVDTLTVSGGGGGGGNTGFDGAGGGGGAGGASWQTGRAVTPGLSYDVTVGVGGDADAVTDPPRSGGSSSSETDSGTTTVVGGGRGGITSSGAGANGACGGGGCGGASGSGGVAPGAGSVGFGGGTGVASATNVNRAGGGGGGMGAAGTNATAGRHGGAGVDHSSHVGTTVGVAGWFCGGGGGGNRSTTSPGGTGGTGGGGQGAGGTGAAISAGVANTGGGGGGARGTAWGLDGGSGIVIYRWAIVPPGVPTSVSVTETDNDSLELSWSAPSTGGPVDHYEVRIDGGAASTATSPHDFTGLTPATSYTLSVRAVGPGAAGSSAWVDVVAETLFPTPPGYYRIDLTLGDHAWSVERGDAPAMGPTLPLSLGWDLAPGAYFPSQPDLTTMTFDVLTADASDLADVVKGTRVSFRMYVDADPDADPWQEFDGVVTQLDGTDVPSGVEGVRNFRATVFCADNNAALADYYVGYAYGDWPAEGIKARLERICAEIGGVDFIDALLADGAEAGLVARPAGKAISALAAIREALKDAATRDGDGTPPTYYGRPTFRYEFPDPSIPADGALVLTNLRRRVFPDRTQTLDGRFVRAGGQWTKQPGPVAAEWGIVDGGVYGTPSLGVPFVVNTNLDPSHIETSPEQGYLGNSLLPDGSTALDGWNTRSLRYLAGYVNPENPDDYADPAPVFYWASFAPLRDGGALPPIVPVVITPIGPELELNGVDYVAGTLTGARLVIPPGGAFYIDFRLRAELLPGSELP